MLTPNPQPQWPVLVECLVLCSTYNGIQWNNSNSAYVYIYYIYYTHFSLTWCCWGSLRFLGNGYKWAVTKLITKLPTCLRSLAHWKSDGLTYLFFCPQSRSNVVETFLQYIDLRSNILLVGELAHLSFLYPVMMAQAHYSSIYTHGETDYAPRIYFISSSDELSMLSPYNISVMDKTQYGNLSKHTTSTITSL